jgi:hypothetical protein
VTFDDIAAYIHTGGQSALLFLVWFVYVGAKRIDKALRTLTDIHQLMVNGRAEQKEAMREIERKIDAVHDELHSLPLNLIRSSKR